MCLKGIWDSDDSILNKRISQHSALLYISRFSLMFAMKQNIGSFNFDAIIHVFGAATPPDPDVIFILVLTLCGSIDPRLQKQELVPTWIGLRVIHPIENVQGYRNSPPSFRKYPEETFKKTVWNELLTPPEADF